MPKIKIEQTKKLNLLHITVLLLKKESKNDLGLGYAPTHQDRRQKTEDF